MFLALTFAFVQTSPLETYSRGKELFEAAYYEEAAPLLRLFVEDPGGAAASKVTSARWMLAQALFFTKDSRGAAKQVRLVMGKGVPDDLPPRFAAFVEEQRRHVTKPTPSPTPAPSPAPAPARPPAPAPAPASEEVVERSPDAPATLQVAPTEIAAPIETRAQIPPWFVRGLPIGIGHFIAKDYVGGSVFMVLTIVSIAANVALIAVNARALSPDGTMPQRQFPAYVAQHVTAGVFYGLLAASVIDGIAFVPQRVADKWAP